MTKLHIGCGWRNFGEEWIHIDGGDYSHVNDYDVKNLPFENNSVDLIYTSHLIAYFDRDEIKDIFKEWYRILKTDGVLRIATPDAETMFDLYLTPGFNLELEGILGPLYGKMKMGDTYIYHKTVYDFESLNNALTNIGFKDVKLYNWRETEHSNFDDHSQAYLPHMDKENGFLISLNVECVK